MILSSISVVHLVRVNHHQLMKRFLVHKCCSIRTQIISISISSISNTCSMQTTTWTCNTIRSFIIKCKDPLWMVAFKCRRYNNNLSNIQHLPSDRRNCCIIWIRLDTCSKFKRHLTRKLSLSCISYILPRCKFFFSQKNYSSCTSYLSFHDNISGTAAL